MNCQNLIRSRTEEVWVKITDKVVPYIKPYYYISNWGRIASVSTGEFKILSPGYDQDGYLLILLRVYPYINSNNNITKRVTKRINRLVMMSFYPLPDNYMELEVNHINNIRDDNHICNLEWATPKENTHHGILYGNIEPLRGSDNPYSKLSEEDVYKIVELAKTGNYNYKELGEIFNVTPRSISEILKRKSWTHLDLDISDKDLEVFRRSSFSDEETDMICKFFETHDINNIEIYPSHVDVVKDCFYSLGLNNKYDFNSKRGTMIHMLNKGYHFKNKLNDYNYNFIR